MSMRSSCTHLYAIIEGIYNIKSRFRARRIFPNDFFLTFMKGILLKRNHKERRERKREGNKLLRTLDLEDAEDNFSKVAAVSDLTQRLRRFGRTDDLELIFKVSRDYMRLRQEQKEILANATDIQGGLEAASLPIADAEAARGCARLGVKARLERRG